MSENDLSDAEALVVKAAQRDDLNQAKEMLLRSGDLVDPRDLNLRLLFFGGLAVGAGLGAAGAYFVTRHRLEMKYNKISEAEIAEMREHYLAKGVALENKTEKPKLEDIVKEQGYSAEPPMAVTPPDTVVEAAQEDQDPIPRAENVFEQPPITEEDLGDPLIDSNWDYNKEKVGRSPIKPYVIHRDEKDENDIYDTVTYTYYEADDVLCNERDDVIGKGERDLLVGEANLGKFGHGSGDPSIVYIRNDKLEMQMEIVLSPNSFAEEVHGFQHSENPRRYRRERSSPDDE